MFVRGVWLGVGRNEFRIEDTIMPKMFVDSGLVIVFPVKGPHDAPHLAIQDALVLGKCAGVVISHYTPPALLVQGV